MTGFNLGCKGEKQPLPQEIRKKPWAACVLGEQGAEVPNKGRWFNEPGKGGLQRRKTISSGEQIREGRRNIAGRQVKKRERGGGGLVTGTRITSRALKITAVDEAN